MEGKALGVGKIKNVVRKSLSLRCLINNSNGEEILVWQLKTQSGFQSKEK